ncbi:alpha-amylase family glycosyl hydrolase [Ruminococcus sp.]|uniref:alpha-amylase family glycosyl hydrolase n=1 Tax=Ruminococcus sp. TaxID=41978 RepID=UPI00388D97AA
MKKLSRILALLMCLAMIISVAVISAQAADEEIADVAADADVAQTGADSIIIHVKSTDKVPYIYYWNALPTNKETSYPGVKMSLDPTQGQNWYTYSFANTSKINFILTDGTSNLSGQISKELTRNAGEWWYRDGRFRSKNPEIADDYTSVDMRQDTIYFVITTRFYDGDKGNNVHCWDDQKANNPDSDPAWRGDFKGLADKLDYIKALGFSAVWITPVVENASGYDYHGYHALDFSKVDPRYESDDFTYEDLIAAAHEKGMKIVQDVVWNHTSNFGEATLAPLFTKNYDADLSDIEACMVPSKELLDYNNVKTPAAYYNLTPQQQYDSRLQLMKQTNGHTDMVSYDKVSNPNNYYHNGYFASLNWDDYTCKFCQIAGDCVDVNTENKAVADYTVDAYSNYLDMGVDGFRVDTVRHIPRVSLNKWYNDRINAAAKSAGNNNFYMFGEVCCRYSQTWYRDNASESVQFYTWDDSTTDLNKLSDKTDAASIKSNIQNAISFCTNHVSCSGQPTSSNAFLNGVNYHTPDYSKNSGMGVIDFTMHWQFDSANGAFGAALAQDQYNNDATWNVTYVESHDYSPDQNQKQRFTGGTQTWAENLNLMFTFRGIPCLYYGGEIEFQKGKIIDEGPNIALSNSGRAYFGDNIEGTVNTTGFSQYSNATGKLATTLNSTLSKHLQKLNAIRRAVPALQLGQYTTNGSYVSGNMAYIRRYTGSYTDPDTKKTSNVDSVACVSVTDGASFKGIPNGTYVDAVSGDRKTVSNGTLSVPSTGKGNMRVYVLLNSGSKVNGAVGPSGQTYLK